MDIWNACKDSIRIRPIRGSLLRIVESQEQVATNRLVNNLQEQAVLEQLLEKTKPERRKGSEHLHYLLYTPFRYPPLPYGSRFGSRFEPSLFYGSKTLGTLLAEAAYYRMVFWFGMRQPPASGMFKTQHTVFSADYKTRKGLQLHQEPFVSYQKQLTHPSRYEDTQQLGSAMRKAGVEAFEYISARDPDAGINVALFQPSALNGDMPAAKTEWLCETRQTGVSFLDTGTNKVHDFPAKLFMIKGRLPVPAL